MARPLKITCLEASRLLSQSMDTPLPLWQRARLRLHLALCDACTNFSRQLRFLRRAVGRLLD
jgi:hypothetical protein